ncbi:MAG: hypothetical protein IJZ38_02115, partial [Bacteroides sp.]|nr:hypothetical protein [Bacteroides sp.]
VKAETLENGLLIGHSLRSSQTLLFNQEVWLLLYQSCLTKHNAENWCNFEVAKSLPTTFYYSIRYLCINQIRNN